MNLIDIANAFQGSYDNAQQRARNQFEMERIKRADAMQQAEIERQKQERSLLAELYAGGPNAAPGVREKLMRVNPQAVMDLDAQQAKNAAMQQERLDQGEKIAANLQRAMAAAKTPQQRAAIEQRAFEMHKRGMIPRIEITGPQSTQGDAAAVGAQADAVLGPEKAADLHLDAIAKSVMHATGLGPNDAGFREAYMQEQRRQEAIDLRNRKAGATTVNVGDGRAGLTNAQTTNVQGAVMDADRAIAELDRIGSAVEAAGGADTLASLGGRADAELKGVALKTPLAGSVGKEDREALRNRRHAESAIAAFRNRIFNKLSGAAVSDSEMKRLMQSVPNVGDSAEDLEAKMQTWRDNLEYERQYGVEALVNGLRTGDMGATTGAAPAPVPVPAPTPGRRAGREAANAVTAEAERTLTGKAPPSPKPPPVVNGMTPGAMAAQLMASGKSPQAIANQVRARFKLTAEQAAKLRARLEGQQTAAAVEGVGGQ